MDELTTVITVPGTVLGTVCFVSWACFGSPPRTENKLCLLREKEEAEGRTDTTYCTLLSFITV